MGDSIGAAENSSVTRGFAIGASILIHCALIAWMLARLEIQSPPAEPPAITVELTRPWSAARRNRTVRPPRSLAGAREQTAAPAPERRLVDAPTAGKAAEAPPAAPLQNDGGLGRTLQQALACRGDLSGLSREDRERCQAQLAAGRKDLSPPKLNLDRRGDFAASQDQEAYLPKMPKKGCKPRAAGTVSVMGSEGAVGGVSCAWSF